MNVKLSSIVRTRTLALVLVGAMIVTIVPLGVAAPLRDDEACKARLQEAHDHIAAHQAELSASDAIQYVLDHAEESCRFEESALEPAAASSPQGSRVFTLADAGTSTRTRLAGGFEGDVSGTEQEVVACSLPGEGAGTIDVSVLNILLPTQAAAGKWYPAGGAKASEAASASSSSGLVEVTGEGALTGGTQAGTLGNIRVLKAIPLAANDGETGAKCLKTTTTTVDTYTVCVGFSWFFGIEVCKEYVDVKTDTKLEACSGSATQLLVVLGIHVVEQTHAYETDPNPCDAVNVLIGDDLDERIDLPSADAEN